MKVYDETNYHELVGDGTRVHAGGEWRLLSAVPQPAGHNARAYSARFSDRFKCFPRSDWPDMLKEQKAKRMRVSDWQKFAPHDQNGLPTCWSNGPAHAATTLRVMVGLKLLYMSACSIAVPISGGHSGGFEGQALEYAAQHGWASVDVWPNNDTRRSLMDDSQVKESREHNHAIEFIELHTFDEHMTAALLGWPTAISYNWWSHVISGADGLEIEPGSFGLDPRNNWGDWGHKNDYGFPGYVVLREGHGTPSTGYAFRGIQESIWKPLAA